MKQLRKYSVQLLCVIVLVAVLALQTIKTEYQDAFVSVLCIFVCVQLIFDDKRYSDLIKVLVDVSSLNKKIQSELSKANEKNEEDNRCIRELLTENERLKKECLRWRDAKNAAYKEVNRIGQENRHLTAQIERLNRKS